MKLRIKKGLFTWQIINDNKILVSKISNKKLIGVAKKICDSQGKIVYTTDIVNLPVTNEHWNNAEFKRYIIYQNEQPIAIATFTYAERPEATRLQILIRPPQINKMNVDTPYGVLFVKRERNNSVTIMQNDEILATVTPFFSFKKMYITHNEKFDDTFFTAIYMLIEYMMHEDDLIVV